MKPSEQFALDSWLSYYPERMSYDQVIEAMTDRKYNSESQYIDVWETVESYDYEQIAEWIEDTRSHFENTVNPIIDEYKTALQDLLNYTGGWDITDKDHPIYKARKMLEKLEAI